MYKIVDENGVKVASNARILKIRIKNGKLKDGVYHYENKQGKLCFSIKYITKVNLDKTVRVIGKELNN